MESTVGPIYAFPEFALTGYPPQLTYAREQAEQAVKGLLPSPNCVYITGYVEQFENRVYSTVAIYDHGRFHHVRKRHPSGSEILLLSGSGEGIAALDLSIGPTVVFICSDIMTDLGSAEAQSLLNSGCVINVIFVSMMQDSFPEWMSKLKDLLARRTVQRVIWADWFHGSGVIEALP